MPAGVCVTRDNFGGFVMKSFGLRMVTATCLLLSMGVIINVVFLQQRRRSSPGHTYNNEGKQSVRQATSTACGRVITGSAKSNPSSAARDTTPAKKATFQKKVGSNRDSYRLEHIPGAPENDKEVGNSRRDYELTAGISVFAEASLSFAHKVPLN